MAETKVTEAFKFDEIIIKEKFAIIEKAINEKIGKRGHNPYVWVSENVNPLIERFMGNKEAKIEPERTKELQEAILKLPDSPVPFFEASNEPVKEPRNRILTPG